MKKLLLVTLFIASMCIKAQTFQNIWAKSAVSTATNGVVEIGFANAGKIIYGSQFQGIVDANPGTAVSNVTSPSNASYYLTCLDAQGNFMFASNSGMGPGGSGTHIIKDMLVDGDTVYVVGEFLGTMQFNGNGIVWNGPSNAPTGFIAKYVLSTTTFVYQWAKPIGIIASGNEGVNGISLGKFGATKVIWTTGYFTGTIDFNPGGTAMNRTSAGSSDIFLAAYDVNGGAQYVTRIGGTGADKGTDIVSDDSNVAVLGEFSNTVNFGTVATPNNLSSNGSLDAFVTKYSTATGTPDWAKKMGSAFDEAAVSIGADANFNIYTTGNFATTANFDIVTTATVSSVNNGVDVFVTKHDANGNFAWVNRYGGFDSDEAGKIFVEPNGNHFITGSYRLLPTINASSVGVADFVSGSGQRIAFVARFDASGNAIYTRNLAGPGSNFGRALNVSPAGDFYIGGRFIQNSGFNMQNGSLPPLLTVGGAATNTNGFIAKYFYCPALTVTATAVTNTLCAGQPINFTATSGYSTYAWTGPASYTSSAQNPTIAVSTTTISGNYTVTVTDANGCLGSATTSITVKPIPSQPGFLSPISNSICIGSSVTITAGSPGTISWFASPTSTAALTTGTVYTTPTLTTNTSYYISITANGCESARTAKTIITTPLPSQPVNLSSTIGLQNNICSGNIAEFYVGTNCNWYTSATGGTSFLNSNIYSTPTLTATTTYYVDRTVNGCTSAPRVALVATVNPMPSVTSQTVQNLTCNGSGNGSISLTLNNPSSFTYDWTPNVSTTYSATSLAAGIYTVQISSGSGLCVTTQTYNVNQPAAYNVPINIIGGNILNFNDSYTGGTTFQWLDCNNGNAPISGAVNAQYTPTVSGSYALVVTDVCASTSTCTSILITGINENAVLNSITLQPNPASTFFTLNNVADGTSVNVMDVTGKVIVSSLIIDGDKTMTIETDNLSNGIYIIQLKNKGAVAHKRLIISK